MFFYVKCRFSRLNKAIKQLVVLPESATDATT